MSKWWAGISMPIRSGGVERSEVVLQALIASEILPPLRADDLEVLMMLLLCDAVPVRVAERASSRPGTASRLRRLVDETAFVIADGDLICLVPVFRLALVRRMATNEPGVRSWSGGPTC